MSIPVKRIREVIAEIETQLGKNTEFALYGRLPIDQAFHKGKVSGFVITREFLLGVVNEYGTDDSSTVSRDVAEETTQIPRQTNKD